jgi:hypothetical protein
VTDEREGTDRRYTLVEIAALTGIPHATLYDAVIKQRVPATIVGRMNRYAYADVVRADAAMKRRNPTRRTRRLLAKLDITG